MHPGSRIKLVHSATLYLSPVGLYAKSTST